MAGATPEQRAQIKNALEIMKRQVATLRLKVEPAGAEVRVDGKPIGVAPLAPEVFLEPGERRLEVSAPGHRAETRVVAAKKGEAQGVEIVLGLESGTAAPASPASAAKPGGSSAPPVQPKDEQAGSQGISTKTVVVIAGAGLTAIALGTGIAFHFKGASAESDADDLFAKAEEQYGAAPCAEGKGAGTGLCSDLADKNDERASANRISTIGFVAAGVFGVATAAAFVFWPGTKTTAAGPRPASGALAASPWLGLNSGGVTLRGVF